MRLAMNDSRSKSVLAFAPWLALLLAGCGPLPPDDAPEDRVTVAKVQGEIKVGQSGADVIQILGSPNIITTDEKRREVWVYDKISTVRTNAERSSYGTLILVGGSAEDSRSETRQRTLTIIIKFDEQKLVRDFAYNYTQF
jgi:outer membrane protein assembly factor BamE (lipoprotein component of BamABCDE complex)